MADKPVVTTVEYLASEETNRRSELRSGLTVREPAAPFFSHQTLVLRIALALCGHVEAHRLGQVAVSPVDVILDQERGLVVQPDVLFIAASRQSIIHNQVWGAPDLVVEVLSDRTEAHDRGDKLQWYSQYGVRECWLVDAYEDTVTVIDFTGPSPGTRVAQGTDPIRSTVLPEFSRTAFALFSA